MLSLSGSFLDATSPEKPGQNDLSVSIPTSQDLKSMSPRHQVFMELLHTEMNYVEILETIVEVSFFSNLSSILYNNKNDFCFFSIGVQKTFRGS